MSLVDDNDPVSLYEIIYVGYSLRSLWDAEEDWLIGSANDDHGSVLDRCRDLKDALIRLGLERCYNAIEKELISLIKEWEEKLPEHAEMTLGEQTDHLLLIIRRLFDVVQREGVERPTFVTMPARQIEVEALLRDPVRWFGLVSPAFMLPEDILIDFHEAARCFAAGFSPSAIMFSLRAAEGVLREYYQRITGKPPGKKWQWASMQNELCEPSFQVPERLIRVLDMLRQQRNYAMHTGQRDPSRWGYDAAAEILQQCQRAISQMSRDLKRRGIGTLY